MCRIISFFILLNISVLAGSKCTSCHGPNFILAPMGQELGKITKDINVSVLSSKIRFFRDLNITDKTPVFKRIMALQVKELNNTEIEDISKKIIKEIKNEFN